MTDSSEERSKDAPEEVPAQLSPTGVYSGKRGFTGTSGPSDYPHPTFTVLGADLVKVAAAPTMKFTVGVTESEGRDVFAIALTIQIHVDPAQRKYDDETKEKLFELFGDPSRWAATTRSFQWAQVYVLVPQFTGATSFDVPVNVTFDLELAAARYFYSLPDGEVPLSFHYSGSIFYRGHDGRIQMVQVPWSCQSKFRLPVEIWRSVMDFYYPNTVWMTLRRQTMEELLKYKTEEGLATLDSCVRKLLGVEDFNEPNPFAFRPEGKKDDSS